MAIILLCIDYYYNCHGRYFSVHMVSSILSWKYYPWIHYHQYRCQKYFHGFITIAKVTHEHQLYHCHDICF